MSKKKLVSQLVSVSLILTSFSCTQPVVISDTGIKNTNTSSNTQVSNEKTETVTTSESIKPSPSQSIVPAIKSSGVPTQTITSTPTPSTTPTPSPTTTVSASPVSDFLKVSSVKILPPASTTLKVGETLNLAAAATMSDNSINTSKVWWVTSNTFIASISTSGVVTAVKTGTVIITVNAGYWSDSIKLTIVPAGPSVSSIKINPPSSNNIKIGENLNLSAVATLSDNTTTTSNITWASSDTSIAKIDSNGVLTALKNGTVTVTAGLNGTTNTISITVTQNPPSVSSIKITTPTNNTTVYVGDTVHVNTLVTMSDGTVNNNAPYTLSINSSGIASFNNTGDLVMKAGGTLSLTAQYGNQTDTITLNVINMALYFPLDVKVDNSGNLYIADTYNHLIKKWDAATSKLSVIVSSGLSYPRKLALDSTGNIYIADSGNNAVKKWDKSTNTVSTIISSIQFPTGLALDNSGNLYVGYNDGIKKVDSANLVSNVLSLSPQSYGIDLAIGSDNNLYMTDTLNGKVNKLDISTNTLSTLISSNIGFPEGLVFDSSGNLFISDLLTDTIKKWDKSTNTVSTIISSGLYSPVGLSMDSSGNLFIADGQNSMIKKVSAGSNTATLVVK